MPFNKFFVNLVFSFSVLFVSGGMACCLVASLWFT